MVGAFLTQNVTDALSSKAFMTMVAQFPAPNLEHKGSSVRKSLMFATFIGMPYVAVLPLQMKAPCNTSSCRESNVAFSA